MAPACSNDLHVGGRVTMSELESLHRGCEFLGTFIDLDGRFVAQNKYVSCRFDGGGRSGIGIEMHWDKPWY